MNRTVKSKLQPTDWKAVKTGRIPPKNRIFLSEKDFFGFSKKLKNAEFDKIKFGIFFLFLDYFPVKVF